MGKCSSEKEGEIGRWGKDCNFVYIIDVDAIKKIIEKILWKLTRLVYHDGTKPLKSERASFI